MSHPRFGQIGDVFKHLNLAAMLRAEPPKQYWESHAGAAKHELSPSKERKFGIYSFFEAVKDYPRLRVSEFQRLIEQQEKKEGLPAFYPGSALIAMNLLGDTADHYLFCDIDGESLGNIRQAVRSEELSLQRVAVVPDDGVTVLRDAAARIAPSNAPDTFVLLDPYYPFEKTAAGMNSIDLFWELTGRGIVTMLWYGFDSINHYQALRYALDASVKMKRLGALVHRTWCMEIHVDKKHVVEAGIAGCGILCGNLGKKSIETAGELTGELCAALSGSIECRGINLAEPA